MYLFILTPQFSLPFYLFIYLCHYPAFTIVNCFFYYLFYVFVRNAITSRLENFCQVHILPFHLKFYCLSFSQTKQHQLYWIAVSMILPWLAMWFCFSGHEDYFLLFTTIRMQHILVWGTNSFSFVFAPQEILILVRIRHIGMRLIHVKENFTPSSCTESERDIEEPKICCKLHFPHCCNSVRKM